MKPSGVRAKALESKGESTLPADRCTTGCTETADRADELARIVALVAGLPGTDADRAAVLARLVGDAPATDAGGPAARTGAAGGGGGKNADTRRMTPASLPARSWGLGKKSRSEG
jgi:hypothetical protein